MQLARFKNGVGVRGVNGGRVTIEVKCGATFLKCGQLPAFIAYSASCYPSLAPEYRAKHPGDARQGTHPVNPLGCGYFVRLSCPQKRVSKALGRYRAAVPRDPSRQPPREGRGDTWFWHRGCQGGGKTRSRRARTDEHNEDPALRVLATVEVKSCSPLFQCGHLPVFLA